MGGDCFARHFRLALAEQCGGRDVAQRENMFVHHHEANRGGKADGFGQPRLCFARAGGEPLGRFIPGEQNGGAVRRRRRIQKFGQPGSSCMAL
jgi:hypothetical protein